MATPPFFQNGVAFYMFYQKTLRNHEVFVTQVAPQSCPTKQKYTVRIV